LGVDIVWLGDDFGMQDRMMINPELWRKLFKPRMKLLIDGYKKLNLRYLLNIIVTDILNPLSMI